MVKSYSIFEYPFKVLKSSSSVTDEREKKWYFFLHIFDAVCMMMNQNLEVYMCFLGSVGRRRRVLASHPCSQKLQQQQQQWRTMIPQACGSQSGKKNFHTHTNMKPTTTCVLETNPRPRSR
jgi:hypothetical protein